MTFLLILALIVAVAAVVFALQNTAPVTVSFLVWQFKDQPLALILLLALAAGVIIGLLTILPGAIRNKWRTISQRKKIEGLEKNLQETQTRLEQVNQELAALQVMTETPPPAVALSSPAPPLEPAPPSEPTPPVEPAPPAESVPPSEQPAE